MYMIKKILFTTLLPLSAPLIAQTAGSEKKDAEDIVYVIEKQEEKINETTLSQNEIENQLIFDMQDIVRHLPGVGVSSDGRFGNNGYSMRGVDKDRVAIAVDGIPQGETFDNLIYKGYGYFNGSINNIETDHLKTVLIAKGADSLFMGSGALGGSVQYVSKDPGDLIRSGNSGLVSRSAYSSKNDEKMQTLGGAFSTDIIEGMLLYTYRSGHETDNFRHENDVFGRARGTPDPQDKKRHSLLSKVNLMLGDAHTLSATVEYAKEKTYTDEKSWHLFSAYHRTGNDLSEKRRYSISDTWQPGAYIDTVKTEFNWQKIAQTAFSTIYEDFDQGYYGDIFEEKNRRLTQYGRYLNNEISFNSWSLLATRHHMTLRTQYATKRFDNVNADTTWLGNPKQPYRDDQKIIRPVSSRDINATVVDEIALPGSQLSLIAGARYDSVAHKPDAGPLSLAKDSDPQPNRYSALSWALTANYAITPRYTLQYKIGKGFRIPTAQELYFDYGDSIAANRVEPNPNLRQEQGLSNEIALSYQGDIVQNKINAYYTKYTDFIDLKQTEKQVPNPWFNPSNPSRWNKPTLPQNHLQYTNVASAYVWGLELTNEFHFAKALGGQDNYSLRNSLSYARGKDASGNALLSIQPFKWVSSLAYRHPSERYGAELFMIYAAKKTESQAIHNGRAWPYLSASYVVFDTTAYYNVSENISLRAGVFNMLNRKYSTWDTLRSLPEFGTTNQIDSDRAGLRRFTAPGRNVAADISFYF
ncbi:TonB-dependent hemoglobin/transferrin/lactoferrin family receptor [Edwardsiella piscicida]|nr:TonB-dependent hemoglobin/transferrin/lactoferrin family receptor [Edwardsiella piscicida]